MVGVASTVTSISLSIPPTNMIEFMIGPWLFCSGCRKMIFFMLLRIRRAIFGSESSEFKRQKPWPAMEPSPESDFKAAYSSAASIENWSTSLHSLGKSVSAASSATISKILIFFPVPSVGRFTHCKGINQFAKAFCRIIEAFGCWPTHRGKVQIVSVVVS